MHFAVLSALSRSDVMQKCGERPRKAVFTFQKNFSNWCKFVVFKYLCVLCVGVGLRVGFFFIILLNWGMLFFILVEWGMLLMLFYYVWEVRHVFVINGLG